MQKYLNDSCKRCNECKTWLSYYASINDNSSNKIQWISRPMFRCHESTIHHIFRFHRSLITSLMQLIITIFVTLLTLVDDVMQISYVIIYVCTFLRNTMKSWSHYHLIPFFLFFYLMYFRLICDVWKKKFSH